MADLNRFRQLDQVTFETKENYKQGMNVPVKVIASKQLLEDMDEGAIDQAANVAQLPGIVDHSLVMPDSHWGYGAPVGSVFATDSDKGGVISPGAIGFDINCLHGSSEVLSELGYRKEIKDMKQDVQNESLICCNLENKNILNAKVGAWMKDEANPSIVKVTTKNGEEMKATKDHPVLTEQGMKTIEEIEHGDKVAINPFQGVKYEEPLKEVILNEEDIQNMEIPFNNEAIIKELKQRNLLPLKYNSSKLPYLIRILSFNMGDGNLVITGERPSVNISFYADKPDLEKIQRDIKQIGYTPPKIYSRDRSHNIETKYEQVEFESTETSINSSARSLLVLLKALGTPVGNKVKQDYQVPKFIMNAPLWQKRLFLSAFFGAEMTAPQTMKDRDYTFLMPTLSVNKSLDNKESGYDFLSDIQDLLEEFGVDTAEIKEVDKHVGRNNDKSIRLRLQIGATNDNLINLFSKIGFEYNEEKSKLANLASQYLKFKQNTLDERQKVDQKAKIEYEGRGTAERVIDRFKQKYISRRFIWRSIFEERKTKVRVPPNFPTFEEYKEEFTNELENSGLVWEQIKDKKEIDFKGKVYDLTMLDENHNFIADNFVVSNCGMRLIRTNLTLEEVQPKLDRLVDDLFATVPTGVGSSGAVRKLSKDEMKQVMTEGLQFCVSEGGGWKEDIKHAEDQGKIRGADPSAVSGRAIDRGRTQLGTLGSGNHYLEIQVLKKENIYDWDIAEQLGLFPEQVVIMIHTGSRGFGHQICTDYLDLFESAMNRYNISVPDDQLACAPIDSQEGQDYYSAMAAGANFAFANRQTITHQTREVFGDLFRADPKDDLEMELVYDVAHNIAKKEQQPDGRDMLIHRKGATRSFGPSHEDLADTFKTTGQPVIIGGSMETGSSLLVGTKEAEGKTFGSTAHGSGRTMSRNQAKKKVHGKDKQREMKQKGIKVKAADMAVLAEESGFAYKNLSEVIWSVKKAGISHPVATFKPIGNIKG